MMRIRMAQRYGHETIAAAQSSAVRPRDLGLYAESRGPLWLWLRLRLRTLPVPFDLSASGERGEDNSGCLSDTNVPSESESSASGIVSSGVPLK